MRQTRTLDDRRAANQVGAIITGIVLGAALLIGVFVIGSIFGTVPATEETTVDNESFSGTFSGPDDAYNYTVAEPGNGNFESYLDDESVYDSTNTALSEGSDYEWYPSNHSVVVQNTTAVDSGESLSITYTYDHKTTETYSVVARFGDAVLLGSVIVIVLFAAVILRVLRSL